MLPPVPGPAAWRRTKELKRRQVVTPRAHPAPGGFAFRTADGEVEDGRSFDVYSNRSVLSAPPGSAAISMYADARVAIRPAPVHDDPARPSLPSAGLLFFRHPTAATDDLQGGAPCHTSLIPSRSTPARSPTRRPTPAPCRSTPRRATSSTTPTHAARLFGLQEFGNIYTRIMNPTTDVFEERIAALEGGVGGARPRRGPGRRDAHDPQPRPGGRQHRVSSQTLYGGTYNLFHYTLPEVGHHDQASSTATTRPAFATAIDERHQGRLPRDDRQPAPRRPRHSRRIADDRPRARRPARRRQHVRAARWPARSSTGPTSSSTRPRSGSAATAPPSAAWSSTAASSTGQPRRASRPDFVDPDPSYHGISYTEAFGAARVHPQAARPGPARHRPGPQPVQRVPVPAGPRDAAAPDPAPQRERPGGRAVAGEAIRGSTG